jgi:hypothetical protein
LARAAGELAANYQDAVKGVLTLSRPATMGAQEARLWFSGGGTGGCLACQRQPRDRYILFSAAFPLLPRLSYVGWGSKKTAPMDHSKHLILLRKYGAGEGIRTLDPNLDKVVLPAAREDHGRNLRLTCDTPQWLVERRVFPQRPAPAQALIDQSISNFMLRRRREDSEGLSRRFR